MVYLVDVQRGDEVRRCVAQKLAAIIPFLEREPSDPRGEFFLRVERIPTAGGDEDVSRRCE